MTDTKKMELHAIISESAYMSSNKDRMKHLNEFYPDEYELLKGHTDKAHFVVKHKPSDKVIMGVRGTDIEDRFGQKKKDLKTDFLVTLGLTKLSNRYKKSDKKLKSLIDEYGSENVSITGHSLGGTIVSNLVHSHDVEGHSFNRGGTHATFGKSVKSLHPKHAERAKKNFVYLSAPSVSKGFDPLSLGTALDPLANIQFVKQHDLTEEQKGVIGPHSIHHFMPKQALPKPSSESATKTEIRQEFIR